MHTKPTKTGNYFRYVSGAKHLWQFVSVSTLLCFSLIAYAGNYLLVNSGSGVIYKQFTSSLTKHLKQAGPGNRLTAIRLDKFSSKTSAILSKKYTTVISTGIEAGIALSQADIDTKIIMAMMPRMSFQDLSKVGKINCNISDCRVVFLDQPVQRQLHLIKLAFPNRHEISLIGSQGSRQLIQRIRLTAKLFGFHGKQIIVKNQNTLITALNQNLSHTDILMTIPDPVVYNRDTARAILLATFNRQIPLFAYSQSFVRAGAVIGMYSTPEQIARQIAELLINPNNNTSGTNQIYPKYFSIGINHRAAEALNITLPKKNYLLKRLEIDEKN